MNIMTKTDKMLSRKEGGIGYLIFNNPDRLNAVSLDMWAATHSILEDFRNDIPRNDIPTMIIHGDDDRILPADATSRRQAKMIKNVKFVELPGGPHGVLWTHAGQINSELVKFLA